MNEESQQAENQNAGEQTSSTATPAVETKTENEVVEQPAGTQDQETSQVEQQQTEKKPTRLEKRLHNLLDKYGDGEQTEQKAQDNASSNGLTPPWQPKVQPGQEVSVDQYEADVTRSAQEIARLEVLKLEKKMADREKARENVRQFQGAIAELEQKYPSLNPDSGEYDEDLNQRVEKLYEEASGKKANATLLKSIVDTVMVASQRARTDGESKVTAKLADQAQEAAIAPSSGGITAKGDLSQAEMQKLKQTNPGKLAEYLAGKLPWSQD